MLRSSKCSLTSLSRADSIIPLSLRKPCHHHLPSQTASLRRSNGRRGSSEWDRCGKVVTSGLFNAGRAAVAEETPWYKKDSELWVEVTSKEEFEKEVLQSNCWVAVEWYGVYCEHCKNAYPEICNTIKSSQELRKHFKFVKASSDYMKNTAQLYGVKALPMMSVFGPNYGLVINFPVPVRRVKQMKDNLTTILKNPDSSFGLDPNSYVVVTGKADEAAKANAAKAKAKAIAELEASKAGVFNALRSVLSDSAGSGSGSSVDVAPQPATASTGTSSNGTSTSTSNGNGNGNGNGKAQSAASAAEEYGASFSKQFGHGYNLAKQAFLEKYRGEYGYDGRIDSLYPTEVGVRMRPLQETHQQQHYLDYTGSSVYCQSQLEAVFDELRNTMFGNPHSLNPSSQLSSEKIDEARLAVLKFFNADPREWQIVFTRSATGALKMVGETFPWTKGSQFRYLRENHNSVLGIREYALQHGAAFQAVDEPYVEEWLGSAGDQHQHQPPEGTEDPVTYSLMAFPAEDNFAGVKYPLSWVRDIKSKSTDNHKWLVLLDAAAYVPTQPLDLSTLPVDFVDIAFYKMFGYPTGLGALLVRTEAVPLLHKVFWGGGSVALATSNDNFHVLKCKPTDKLEDGTVSFLDIIALRHGFAMINKLGGITSIQSHVAALTEWAFRQLSLLRHSNGAPIVTIFGKHSRPNSRQVQGGILNFEVLSPTGAVLSYKTFEREAAAAGFHVRTGAECNPGACYAYLGVKEVEVEALAGQKEGCDDDFEFIEVQRPAKAKQVTHSSAVLQTIANTAVTLGHPAEVAMKWMQVPLGSVRASLGYMSTFEDVYGLVDFIAKNYKDRSA